MYSYPVFALRSVKRKIEHENPEASVHAYWRIFRGSDKTIMVEVEGVEPSSEHIDIQLSPSADSIL